MSTPTAEATPVQSQAVRRVPLQFDENGDPVFHSVTSPDSFKVHALGVLPPKHVIPVIFVPGIMGTNLRTNGKLLKEGTPAWLPPNGIWAGLGEWRRRKSQTPRERQIQMAADGVEVDDTGPVSVPKTLFTLTEAEAKRRHWGEVHHDSYAGILAELELALNDQYQDAGKSTGENAVPKPLPAWLIAKTLKRVDGHHGVIDVVSHDWHPVKTDVPPMSDTEFTKLGDYYYPVWACGYNWLGSNEDSADRLVARIQEALDWYSKGKYWIPVGKVVVVTHSMGGLVARRAAQKAGDNMLGVIHGVQPVGGAPVVYRRLRAGVETDGFLDIQGAVLATIVGWSAADTTCVLANSAGPLELLPTKFYPPGWLRVEQQSGGKTMSLMPALPLSDPYEEIYSKTVKDAWWGTVDEGLLDPADLAASGESTPIKQYRRVLKTAETFHDNVKLDCHPITYAYYGSDPKQVSFGSIAWTTRDAVPTEVASGLASAAAVAHTDLGRVILSAGTGNVTFSLENRRPPTDDDRSNSGDGTVPLPSGALIAQGSPTPKVFSMKGFDHQMSYGNANVQDNVLYCIGKIVQLATPIADLPQRKE